MGARITDPLSLKKERCPMIQKQMYFIRGYYILLLLVLYLSFYEKSVFYLFFTNTILAYIPIELARWVKVSSSKLVSLVLILFWLLFFPNNFYLFTDLFHLSLLSPYDPSTMMISVKMEIWYKLLLVVLSVFPTTFFGCESLWMVTNVIVKKIGIGVYQWLVISVVLFINAIGIYFGRFLRLNSTDVFTDSKETFMRFVEAFTKIDGPSFLLIVLIFFFSLIFVYIYRLGIKFALLAEREELYEDTSSRR